MNLPAASPWSPLLPVALAGTARDARPLPTLPGVPAPDPADAAGPARQLLRTAAALAVVERAGFRAPAWNANPPAELAAPDEWPALGPGGAALLRQAQQGNGQYELEFCLEQLLRHRRRLPRPLLPWAIGQPAVRKLVPTHFAGPAVLGAYGPWLSERLPGQRPVRAWLSLEQAWQSRSAEQREKQLRELLDTDPARAYQLAEAVLPGAPEAGQLLVLETLLYYRPAGRLPATLAPLLQACRAQAALAGPATSLLLATEGNELLPRRWALARPWLTPAGPGLRLTGAPEAWSEEWRTLGLSPTALFSHSTQGPTEELTGPRAWVYQAALYLPPSYWAAAWQLPMAEAIARALASPEVDFLPKVWEYAAAHLGDAAAARPLLDYLAARGQVWPASRLARLLPPEELADWIMSWVPGHPGTRHGHHSWLHDLSMLFLRERYPAALVSRLVPLLRERLTHPDYAPGRDALHRRLPSLFYEWGNVVRDPAALAAMATLLPLGKKRWASTLEAVLRQATFRSQFVASLAETPEPAA